MWVTIFVLCHYKQQGLDLSLSSSEEGFTTETSYAVLQYFELLFC